MPVRIPDLAVSSGAITAKNLGAIMPKIDSSLLVYPSPAPKVHAA